MSKRKEYPEEYDADNFAYQEDYEDFYDADDVVDDEQEDEDEFDVEDDVETPFNPDEFNTIDLPTDKRSFDPADYDFEKIMEDYNSGNKYRKEHAIEQAVYAMDALVKFVINRHYPTYREKHYEDMLQEGRMAIVDTLGGYTGKCAPSSYFYTTIRHQIQVYIAESVHRTTRHYAAMANKIRKAELALAQIDGKEHHDDLTISVYTGLPLTTVIETRRQTLAADFVELNPNLNSDNNTEDDDTNPVSVYWKVAKTEAIQRAISRLLPTEGEVIRLMYGLNGEQPLNPPAIAKRLNLKTDQVRKIAQDACRKLGQDKQLVRDIGTYDKLESEKEKVSVEMPFVNILFGQHTDFFDDIAEESDSDENSSEITSLDELLQPMKFSSEE